MRVKRQLPLQKHQKYAGLSDLPLNRKSLYSVTNAYIQTETETKHQQRNEWCVTHMLTTAMENSLLMVQECQKLALLEKQTET